MHLYLNENDTTRMEAMSFNDLRSVNNTSTFYRASTDRDTESWGFFKIAFEWSAIFQI